MFTETVTYKDYNDVERTEKVYFNLSDAELMEMEMSVAGGFAETIERIIEAQDTPELIKIFKDLLLKAYGEKSPDGRRFVKSEELSTAFSQTEMYSILFTKYALDDKAAAKFINGLIPKDSQFRKDKAANLSVVPEGTN